MELFAEDIGTHTYTCSLFYPKPLYVNSKQCTMGMPHLDRPDKLIQPPYLLRHVFKGLCYVSIGSTFWLYVLGRMCVLCCQHTISNARKYSRRLPAIIHDINPSIGNIHAIIYYTTLLGGNSIKYSKQQLWSKERSSPRPPPDNDVVPWTSNSSDMRHILTFTISEKHLLLPHLRV